jgi:hypothetical protein
MVSSSLLCLTLASAALLRAAAQSQGSANLTLTMLDAQTVSPGGRCADGTMAGYYIHEGTDPSLFVIFLEGGGACYDEITCTKRTHMHLGTSKAWAATVPGTNTYDSDCSKNPDFCKATHVYVAYCTGDLHAGNNTSPSSESWGLYFDGHANFAAIVSELQLKHGLNSAKRVLLTGSSAGGVGTFKNVDYLASCLPQAKVKGAPDAGWFFPAALPSDLPNIYSPSDWAHFSVGQHGNQQTAANGTQLNEFVHGTLWQERGLYPPACVADQKPDQWWVCGTVDKLYRYVRSGLFVLEAQYDTDQIFQQVRNGCHCAVLAAAWHLLYYIYYIILYYIILYIYCILYDIHHGYHSHLGLADARAAESARPGHAVHSAAVCCDVRGGDAQLDGPGAGQLPARQEAAA